MKRCWFFQRKDRPGYYCQWTESGKTKTKQVDTLRQAKNFCDMMYLKLNTEVLGVVDLPFDAAIEEYLQKYDLQNLSPGAKYLAKDSLDNLKKFGKITKLSHINQRTIDNWILNIRNKYAAATVNRFIARIKTFLRWCKKRNYKVNPLEINQLKEVKTTFKCPSNEQIKALIARCPSQAWRAIVLVYLTTGLRRNDVKNLPKSALDLENASLDTISQKTGKSFTGRPLPDAIMPELKKYLETLPPDEINLFPINNYREEWGKFKGEFTFQTLRKTFSTLIQRIGSIGTAQKLLEHHSSKLTTTYYTDEEIVLRWKVNQLPIATWL